MDERSDWVEILEPRSRERMYINLESGQCGWEPPPNVKIRQADKNQWWELFDQNNNRFYYYNAISCQTVWHRPPDCDIVPLAKLQAMKRSSQLDLRSRINSDGSKSRGSTSSDGRDTPVQMAFLQELCSKSKEANNGIGEEVMKDPGRETHIMWQPAPGTKAAMLVKVNSVRKPVSAASSDPQLQSSLPATYPNTLLTKPTGCVQPQQFTQTLLAAKSVSMSADTSKSMHVKKTENGGFLLVLSNGANYQSPQRSQTGIPQPQSPRCGASPPVYDEPCIESPIYDEPPLEMDMEAVHRSEPSSPQMTPTHSCQKQLQSLKVLQNSGIHQQDFMKHRRTPSATEYSPAGRECIKHMVSIEQVYRWPHSPNGTVKPQTGQLLTKDSFKQSRKALEASVLKNIEAHHSRQSSLQSQEYPTVVSQQDSGYSTGPSPSLRKRRGRRQVVANGRPGSVGSSSELNALNDKLIAEMREFVGKPAANQGSKACVDIDMMQNSSSVDSNKIRLTSEQLKLHYVQVSRDDITASNRSLYRPVSTDIRAGDNNDQLIQQDVIRQKRTYEKVDSLDKSTTSQASLASPGVVHTSSQAGTLESSTKFQTREHPCNATISFVYHFPYTTLRKPIPESSMTDWASKNLNMHTQGIFRRRVSIANMLSWSGGSIRKPMLITSNRILKKEACEMFKLVQMYMGDRQARADKNEVALIAVTKCWTMQGLRDELYIQLVRQTTDNHCCRSLSSGWELMAISLAFFSPSPKFQSYLEGYIYRHLDPVNDKKITERIKELLQTKNRRNSKSSKKRKQNCDEEGLPISTYAQYCYRKLQKVAITGGKKGLRKPTVEEIEHARNAVVTPSLFGSSLEEIMLRQQELYPERKLPWVQTQLSQQVLLLGGAQTEGIFRVPGDIDEVNALKLQVDQWRIPENMEDPNIPASLLKLWYRELEEPLIPPAFYKQCITNYENPDAAVAVVESLPELNRLVLFYLIHFLQVFAKPANVSKTKMDVNNLAMVMAPNCLQCQSEDPKVIFENTRKEMSFLRILIVHLDTSCIRDVL
ncbi:rho GTPase-activating protein 39-like [Protopterus annectens]|uniref:rho GTPase-activating protein 39-like n=1 Tax=Protopterus annectens TaxID=7888 RepID=UPI001CFA8046|nr:rho GTPase-activating protein 39-like [Protopterus annectens]